MVLLLGSTVLAIRDGAYSLIFPGMLAFILCEYLAFIALQPAALSISVAPASRAGEEAIGILSFLVKLGLRLVPVAYGVGVVWGAMVLFYACYLALMVSGPAGNSRAAEETAASGARIVQYSAASPLVSYVLFLFYYLSIDLIRAILSVPGKLDALQEKNRDRSDSTPLR
jgi:hypothetical protein